MQFIHKWMERSYRFREKNYQGAPNVPKILGGSRLPEFQIDYSIIEKKQTAGRKFLRFFNTSTKIFLGV